MSLAAQTAVVTGSAAGIGRACAIRLAEDGADIAALDIDDAGVRETARLVEATGRRCVPIAVDLLDRTSLSDAFAQVADELGSVSVLHSNAGGTGGEPVRTFAKSEVGQWDRLTQLNLGQNIDCIRQVVNEMIDARYGRIIITSSEMAWVRTA